MTKDYTTIRKELAWFTERRRAERQTSEVVFRLMWTLTELAIAYWIFLMAIEGVKAITDPVFHIVGSLLVVLISYIWILFEVDFWWIYIPIATDAKKGFALLSDKIRAAADAWRGVK